MADSKNVIIKFKKDASADDKQKIIKDLTDSGATVKNTDNVNSSIFPFVAASVPAASFNSLKEQSLAGHDVVDHIEEDQEMRIQS